MSTDAAISERNMGVALAVVVPMFNERAGAKKCVEQITNALWSAVPDGVLIVVDDGSSDGTGPLLDDLCSQYGARLKIVHHGQNLGYGAALRTGARSAAEAGACWALFMDSDLTNPPSDIGRFAELAKGPVDYIKASRYAAGGAVVGVPFKRRVISRTGNWFAHLVIGLPLSDLTNGFRAVKVEPLLRMPLRERGFPVIMEELYWVKAFRLNVTELSTILSVRDGALRSSSFRYQPRVVWSYARYPLKSFIEPVVHLAKGHRKRVRVGEG